MAETPLTNADLIRDEPLDKIAGPRPIPDELDLLNHRSTARRVGELVRTAAGHMNIAVFGPWGSGKSSFFGLLEQQLQRGPKPVQVLRFDAWQNAGSDFRANFLAELSSQLGVPGFDERLFSSKRSVRLPFVNGGGQGKRRGMVFGLAFLAALIVIGAPVIHTSISAAATQADFWTTFWPNWFGWIGVGASGSVIFVALSTVLNLAKVDVDESMPSHVSQFRSLFRELLDKKKSARYAVLIDELDRCAPDDVMATLEGLRTFLGHERCVFVVAFDRAAIAETIQRHSRNNVPLRQGSAYYATAGEYLDKIFQFQVSLPPQPFHTSRRYALSLVREMGGVWGSLRAQSDSALNRVVQILSPIHLRSPRRTKVLLNDFAVNIRLYEAMGFDWLNRAEEIAAWTVIQTEFPGLAMMMESDTRALTTIVGEIRAETETSTAESDEDPLEDVEAEVVVAEDEGPDDPRVAEVTSQLRGELRTYLRRLVELEVPLPRADLVLMHAGGDLLRFEDPTVYNLMLDVADLSQADAAELLAHSSEHDRAQAVLYMIEQLESEVPDIEKMAILGLIGEIASQLPVEELRSHAEPLRRLWNGNRQHRKSIARSGTALIGYSRALVGSAPADLRDSLADIASLAPDQLGSIIERIADDSSDSQFAEAVDVLIASAVPRVTASPSTLASLLRRTDTLDPEPSLETLADSLRSRLSFKKPKPVVPATATAAAETEAKEANEKATSRFEAANKAARRALEVLTAETYRDDGSVRAALAEVLIDLEGLDDWPLVVHDAWVLREPPTTSGSQRNTDLLRAIARKPQHAAGRWVDHLRPEFEVAAEDLEKALITVIDRGATTTNEATMTNAISNQEKLLKLKTSTAIDFERLLDAQRPLLKVASWDDVRVRTAFQGLTQLEASPSVALAVFEFQRDLLLALLDSGTASEISTLSVVDELQPTVRSMVATVLDPGGGDLRTSVVVRCQQARSVSELVHVTPAAVVTRAPEDADVVSLWLRTGPPLSLLNEVRTSLGNDALEAASLDQWAALASVEDRTELWRELVTEGELTLAAAAAGRELAGGSVDEFIRQAAAASSAAARADALVALHYLPAESLVFRRGVAGAFSILHAGGTQQDLATAVALLERGPTLSGGELSKMRRELEGWLQRHPRFVSRQRLRTLADRGFVRRRALDAVFELLRGGREES